jgi:hypothetical protein
VNAKCFELREREDNRATSVDTSYKLSSYAAAVLPRVLVHAGEDLE